MCFNFFRCNFNAKWQQKRKENNHKNKNKYIVSICMPYGIDERAENIVLWILKLNIYIFFSVGLSTSVVCSYTNILYNNIYSWCVGVLCNCLVYNIFTRFYFPSTFFYSLVRYSFVLRTSCITVPLKNFNVLQKLFTR